MLKKILVPLLAVTFLVASFPASSFAAEKRQETPEYNQQKNVSSIVETQATEVGVAENGDVSAQGWKKDFLVYGLKYGGDAVGELLDFVSPKYGKLVKEHSFELGVELDRLSKNIENSMRDFMHDELGFSWAASRNIAWAIMQVIG